MLLMCMGLAGCHYSDMDCGKEGAQSPERNLLVIVLNDTLSGPSEVLPNSFGGGSSMRMHLDTLAEESLCLRMPAMTDDVTEELLALSESSHWFSRLEEQGWQTGFAGSWPEGGDPVAMSYWIGLPTEINGLPVRDAEGYGGQGAFVPVLRTGMTAAVNHPLNEAYHIQVGQLVSEFMFYQGVNERPWAMWVSLRRDRGDGRAYDPDPQFIRQAAINHVAEPLRDDAARVLAVDQSVGLMLEELVWLEQDTSTLVVVIADSAAGGYRQVLMCAPDEMALQEMPENLTWQMLRAYIEVWMQRGDS